MSIARDELVHPLDSLPHAAVPALIDGDLCQDRAVVATVERICGVLKIETPQVYVLDRAGHAWTEGAIGVSRALLSGLAGDEREALLAHCLGHVLLPEAGELSADRVAAVHQGSADAITRLIFREADLAHDGLSHVDPAVRVREIQAWTATPTFSRLIPVRAGRSQRFR